MKNKIIPPKNCQYCGGAMKEYKGVSKKTGRPYHFLKCQNPECGSIWNFPAEEPKISPNQKAMLLIMDELREINERLDKMAEYLVEKFDSLTEGKDERSSY